MERTERKPTGLKRWELSLSLKTFSKFVFSLRKEEM
jgi:hypothetical protein